LPTVGGLRFRYSPVQTKNLTKNTMNKLPNLTATRLALALAAGLVASAVSSQAQSALATISETSGGGGTFDYTITLQNTGSDSLNSFWYGWTPGVFDLPLGSVVSGTTVTSSSLGWVATIDNTGSGDSIQWQNSASAPSLTAGESATFTFDSPTSLSAITTSPSGESVAFTTDAIQFNQGVSGQSTPIFSPTSAVPEPSSLGLMAGGLIGMVGSCRWLSASRKAKAA